MKKYFFFLMLLAAECLSVKAQAGSAATTLNDMLAAMEDSVARITDIGVMVGDVELYVKEDSLTHQRDSTLMLIPTEIVWQSEGCDVSDPAAVSRARQVRGVRRKAIDSNVTLQHGKLQDSFQNFYYYVFRYEYMSVDAEGKPVMLSAMAACPTKEGASEINNVIIGTHITITANSECPSQQFNNYSEEDWGMLMSLASGPKLMLIPEYTAALVGGTAASAVLAFIPVVGVVFAATAIAGFVFTVNQADKALAYHAYNNNLVIMADYEGYGTTKTRAHPYLYQELTARQCVDATLVGIKLYKTAEQTKFLRHPFRSDFRTVSCGYSQGGSVAMAVHRFIEQNNLDQTLHFSGSYCGDGPYDPVTTLMYYVGQYKEGKPMSMPVVLPLIVKGMLDTNPYMKGHKAEEYFRPEFLSTGIMDWLASKSYSTVGIDDCWRAVHNNNPAIMDYSTAKLTDIMNDECYSYFEKLYEANKNTYTKAEGVPLPQKRGVMEDLHLALASNDMTANWKPRHNVYLFHSKEDTVVPYVNAEKARNAFGYKSWIENAPNGLDHVPSGKDFFRGDSNIGDVVFERTFNLRLYDYISKICGESY